jgi:hypothetical protein
LTHAIAADSENIDFLVNRSQCYYETREFDAAVMALLLLMLLSFSNSIFFRFQISIPPSASLLRWTAACFTTGDSRTTRKAALVLRAHCLQRDVVASAPHTTCCFCFVHVFIVSTGDAASDLEAALTKALDETLMSSCFYNLGLCKVSCSK